MNYKKSNYNVEIDNLENGRVLMFNTYSRAFGIMNQKCLNLYNNIKDIKENLITDKEDINNFKVMKENFFIINEDIDELKVIKINENICKYRPSDVLSLTIAPTLNCNMDCPYCYEKKNNSRMSDETMNDLINFIQAHLTNKKYLQITWYGGEPLLEKKRIYEMSKEIIKICEKKEIKYFADIVTNGVLLDYDTAKVLKEECKVTWAQITLDGYGEENNKRRLLKNGGDSFKIITQNIEKAKEFLEISIRINVDKSNSDSIFKLVEFFRENKWNEHKNINPYIAPVDNLDDRDNANKSLCYSAEEFLSINSLFTNKLYENRIPSTLQALIPARKVVSCGAICLENSYVIDPDGLLYPCWDFVGMKEHNTGNVKDGELMNKEKIKWLELAIPIKCEGCILLPLCLGGCPSKRLVNKDKKTCSNAILNYKENLKLVYKYYQEAK